MHNTTENEFVDHTMGTIPCDMCIKYEQYVVCEACLVQLNFGLQYSVYAPTGCHFFSNAGLAPLHFKAFLHYCIITVTVAFARNGFVKYYSLTEQFRKSLNNENRYPV